MTERELQANTAENVATVRAWRRMGLVVEFRSAAWHKDDGWIIDTHHIDTIALGRNEDCVYRIKSDE